MASKTRKKNEPSNIEQPAQTLGITLPPAEGGAVEPAAPEPNAEAPEGGDEEAPAEDGLRRLVDGLSMVRDAVAEAMAPTPQSVIVDRHYTHVYGSPVADLMLRHALVNTQRVGWWLAEMRDVLLVTPREDVLFPLALEGEPKTVDQLVGVLTKAGEDELSELLISDLRKYKSEKVARAVIISFANAHVRLLEQAERDAADEGEEV